MNVCTTLRIALNVCIVFDNNLCLMQAFCRVEYNEKLMFQMITYLIVIAAAWMCVVWNTLMHTLDVHKHRGYT